MPLMKINSSEIATGAVKADQIESGLIANTAASALATTSVNFTATQTFSNAVTFENSITVNTNASAFFIGPATFSATSDQMQVIEGANSNVTHNIAGGGVFYHVAPLNNFTPDFTNVNTSNNRTTVVTLIIPQGETAKMPTSVKVNGSPTSVSWQGSSEAPAGTANKIDVVSFSLIRQSATWTVLGQSASYG